MNRAIRMTPAQAAAAGFRKESSQESIFVANPRKIKAPAKNGRGCFLAIKTAKFTK
jgi:hypothetical protein